MTLEEAIEGLINLGEKDPLEIARQLERRHGDDWVREQLAAHSEEILSEIARQRLGRERRAATLPAVLNPVDGRKPRKRDTMVAPIFIPGVGWKSLGHCTTDDLAAREQFYLRAAGAMVRWASWCRECIEAMRAQGVQELGKLRGPLPELPEAEAV